MRRVISAICILVMMMAASTTALAATVQVATEPAQLTSAGTVKIKFSIANDSAYEMRNINISGFGVSGSDTLFSQVVPPNGALNFSLNGIEISEDMLGQTLTYTLTWNENGQQKSKDVGVKVGTQQALEMTATRTASKTSGKEGDKIILTYTLNNPGTLSMTDITVKDSIAGNTAVASGLSIEPGASRTVTYEYTLGKQDASSQPTVTYKLNGEGKALTIDALAILVVNVQLDVAVATNDPTPEGVLFTLVLTNKGNQTINKIVVKDELGNSVNEDSFTLEAGKEKTLSYTVPTTELRNVSFTITGTDASGQPYENKTTGYEVKPYVDPGNVSLSLVATVLQPLSDSGRMQVRFAVQNNSNVDITDAVISETELGTLETIDILPLGETVVEKELLVGDPRELEFTLTASDPSGAQHTNQAKVTAAYVALASPTPVVTDDEGEEGAAAGGMSDTLITVLIVLAALMAVAGIALLALSIYERKRNAAMEDDEPDELPRARMGTQPRGDVIGRREADVPSARFAQRPGQAPIPSQRPGQAPIPQRPPQPVQNTVPPAQARPTAQQPYPPVKAEQPPQAPVQPQGSVQRPPQNMQYQQQQQNAQYQPQAKVAPQAAPVVPPIPQASPEIRNRVHRVRPADKDQ